MTQGVRERRRVAMRRWMRTISTVAVVGMVGVLYLGTVGSDDVGRSDGSRAVGDSIRTGAEVVLSECIADDRFAGVELEANSDGILVIEGLDPGLSPEQAADLLRAIQACIVVQP